jgi:hypothetical protein
VPVDNSTVTLLADAPASIRAGSRDGRPWRRAWGLPVWAHLLALGAVLLLLVPVVGTSQAFLADEGAAMIQARSLAAGDGWIVEHPLPEVDPEGVWYPIPSAEHGDRGAAPLGKHPAYPLLAAAATRLGGVTGVMLLSLAGTVAAAGLAAALAGRIDRGLVRPTLWVVGLASPMLFDGYLAMAHSLGAALATAALLAAVAAVQGRRPTVALLVAPAVAGAVLLRNEALLFAAALALVAGVVSIRRAYRVPAAVVAGATVAAVVGARLVERMWIAHVTGSAVAVTSVGVPASGDGFLRGRVHGFLATWLNPTYGGPLALRLALLVMLPAIGWCALRSRIDPEDRVGILGGGGVAAAAAVIALVMAPENVVPGLLVAFPLATAGLLVLRRRLFEEVGLVVIGATAALFAMAVLATQYAEGGTGEWGGRYFALLVPAAVPLFLAGLRLHGRALPSPVRRGVAVALAVCSLALSTMAIGGLRASHQIAAHMVARIETAGRTTGDPRPVVLTTWVGGSRLAWPTFEDHRWLYVPGDDVALAARRLREAGIDRFLFVTMDIDAALPQLAGFTVVSIDDRAGFQILVLGS